MKKKKGGNSNLLWIALLVVENAPWICFILPYTYSFPSQLVLPTHPFLAKAFEPSTKPTFPPK
jgi:hypothetical protein